MVKIWQVLAYQMTQEGKDDHSNIDNSADNCAIEMVPVLLRNIGDTSVLCRMWSGITRSGHNTEVSSQSVTQTAWD